VFAELAAQVRSEIEALGPPLRRADGDTADEHRGRLAPRQGSRPWEAGL